MSGLTADIDGGRAEHTLHIGGVFASQRPSVIRTVLGSCIAVCLWDPVARVGGMNHFMLPETTVGEAASTRYGANAMRRLIEECVRAGASRQRLEAKVFGGGHVLMIEDSDFSVPKRNIHFAFSFLEAEGIPVVSHDVGGRSTRKLLFFTDTGRALLHRPGSTPA